MEILHTPPLGDNEILRGKGYFTLKEDDEDSSEVEFADNESEDHKSISHGEEELEGFELQPLDETETNVPPNVSWSTSFTNSGMLLLDEGKEKKKSKKKLSLIQWYKKLDSELADRPVDGWFGWLPVIASFMVHFVMLSKFYFLSFYFFSNKLISFFFYEKVQSTLLVFSLNIIWLYLKVLHHQRLQLSEQFVLLFSLLLEF